MKKILSTALCLILALALTACSAETAESTNDANVITDGDAWARENGYVKADEVEPEIVTVETEVTDPNAITDGDAWALANGYVKASNYNIDDADSITSATQTGVGGLNFGTVEWTEDLKKAAINEYLKGDESTLFESGYNHRNMFSIATSYNNTPVIGSVEFAMNDDFTFTGGSEQNTEKLNVMQKNNEVALYWTRQFRDSDGMPSYFYSYGVEIRGTVEFYDWTKPVSELTTEIAEVRNYFKTMGAMYGKYFDPANENYLDDQALVDKMAAGATTYYRIVPSKIVITSPYVLFMMNNNGAYQVINTTTGQWMDYPFVSTEFLDMMAAQVATVYQTPLMNGMQLAPMLAAMGMEVPADGIKTQATLEF